MRITQLSVAVLALLLGQNAIVGADPDCSPVNEPAVVRRSTQSLSNLHSVTIDLTKDRTVAPLGIVGPGEQAAITLQVVNPFSEEITIEEVLVSCGCINVDAGPSVVLPGKRSHIRLSIKPDRQLGPRTLSATISVNRSSSGRKKAVVIIKYRVVGPFDVHIPSIRWAFDTETAEPTFTFYLRGYRHFDLSRVHVDVSGVEADVTRTKREAKGNETSLNSCMLTLKRPESLAKLQKAELTLWDHREGKGGKLTQRHLIVIEKTSSVSVSPRTPRFIQGQLTFFVRFTRPPDETPRISLKNGAYVVQSLSVKELGSKLYRVRFERSPSLLQLLDTDGRTDMVVDTGQDVRVHHLSDFSFQNGADR